MNINAIKRLLKCTLFNALKYTFKNFVIMSNLLKYINLKCSISVIRTLFLKTYLSVLLFHRVNIIIIIILISKHISITTP